MEKKKIKDLVTVLPSFVPGKIHRNTNGFLRDINNRQITFLNIQKSLEISSHNVLRNYPGALIYFVIQTQFPQTVFFSLETCIETTIL